MIALTMFGLMRRPAVVPAKRGRLSTPENVPVGSVRFALRWKTALTSFV